MTHNIHALVHLVPDENVANILNQSLERWLTHDELMELFLHWRQPHLPVSIGNPPVLEPGLYFFNTTRAGYTDANHWTPVNQPGRLNCASLTLPTDNDHRVGCTVASVGNFFRRTHHIWDLDTEEALVEHGDNPTIVHYRLVGGGDGGGANGGGGGGGRGDGGGAGEGDGDGQGGGGEEGDGDGDGQGGGGDEGEDDGEDAQDPDYVPSSESDEEEDEREPLGKCHSRHKPLVRQ